MGAVLYTSVIAVTDLGRLVMNVLPVGTDWSFVNILFYLLIIGFSLLIRRYTLTRYSDIPVFSVAMIMLGAICSSSLIIGKTILNVKIGGISQDTFFIFTLAVIYILIVSSYMIIYFHSVFRLQLQRCYERYRSRYKSFGGKLVVERYAHSRNQRQRGPCGRFRYNVCDQPYKRAQKENRYRISIKRRSC